MLLSLSLPSALANAIALEAARTGQTPASWLLDRLHDRFGTAHVASAARVRLIDPEPTQERDR